MSHWIRTGLLSGLLLAVLMLGPIVVFGPRPDWMQWGEVLGYTFMVLCLTATYFAMRTERERRGGSIGYGAALGIGVGVSLVAALAFGAATWVLYATMSPALPDALMAHYADQVRASGLAPSEVEAQLAALEAMRPWLDNHPLQAALMFATVFPIGVIESLVGAAIVRRRG